MEEHFTELLNKKRAPKAYPVKTTEPIIPSIFSEEEINNEISSLKNKKACGSEGRH